MADDIANNGGNEEQGAQSIELGAPILQVKVSVIDLLMLANT